MATFNSLLALIKDFLEKNPTSAMIILLLSLISNCLQVISYFQGRIRLNKEREESEKLKRLLETYGWVAEKAVPNMKSEEDLAKVKEEIKAGNEEIGNIHERMEQIRIETESSLLKKTIEFYQISMVSSYEEIQRLRRELPKNEKINEIPDDIKATIDQEFHTIVNRPYEFPRKFLFRSLLLVLFILLLPWPVDALLLPLLSNAFILTFFEAASLYPGLRIREALFRSWGWITFGICFGIWYSWISVFQTFFIASFSSFFSTAIRIGFAIIVAIIHRFSIGINIKFAVGYFTKISRNDVTSIEDVFR